MCASCGHTQHVFLVCEEKLMETKLFLQNWGYFVSPVDSVDESHNATVFL